ncbi:hypothetical protein L1O03_00575 [Corynebacterium uropygiale]|uniref:Uncharacterized protein n=1 Tax=Corynebacterium uropygiale TaxID=1775911 RepID=A0A9X1QPY5_9CORY|nr:hypothetical protein [Corynebacterium uropygiale]MCF4005678.1 hypothetical protein [Corynebacterium uropygiale]
MNKYSALEQAIAETEDVERGDPVRRDTIISSPGRTRDRILHIRLTEEEYQALRCQAGSQPVSAYARDKVLHSDEAPQSDIIAHAVCDALRKAGYVIAKDDAA